MADAARTVVIWQQDAARGTPVVEVGLGETEGWASGPASPLTSVALFSSVNTAITIVTGGSRVRATSSWISAGFFDTVGTHPQLGRQFEPADEPGEAPRTAVISAEARALQQDLDLAARVQLGLLPPRARIDGWEAAYHYQPAGAVSGDYCDLIGADNGDAYFLLGDVAGKGVSAAMLMSHLSAMLRALVSVGLPLNQLMERASRVFCESTLPMHYATLVCGRASASGEIELCNAGHLPPLLVGPRGVTTVDATGLPIGMFSVTSFASVTVRPSPGETLLLYSDGLIEAENADGFDYGMDRLRTVTASAPRTPRSLVDACVRDVAAFRGRPQFADDLTVFAVSRL